MTKPTKKMQRLLERMAKIERMERGKLCRMVDRPYYNHQTWQEGRNVVRYVPDREVCFLRQAIHGYQEFMKLAEQYADEVINRTRRERGKAFQKPHKPANRRRAPKAPNPQNEKIES
jgi:hypothetical protein